MSSSSVFLRRVVLKNYKNIASCAVALRGATFLLGPSGSGKSNFLDALDFTAEALSSSIEFACRSRGGIGEVRRRSFGHPTNIGVRLEWSLPGERTGIYAFLFGSRPEGNIEILRESCAVSTANPTEEPARFEVREGKLQPSSPGSAPWNSKEKLYLAEARSQEPFAAIYDALVGMRFYRLSVEAIREWQTPTANHLLVRSGRNLASILRELTGREDGRSRRVFDYLGRVVPGVVDAGARLAGSWEVVELRQSFGEGGHVTRFDASQMSDGVLRALGVLVALFHWPDDARTAPRLVGIDEVELGLHAGAATILRTALLEAAGQRQFVVTGHAADILDDAQIPTDSLVSTICRDGNAILFPMDEVGRRRFRNELLGKADVRGGDGSLSGSTNVFDAVDLQPDLFGGT